MESVFWKRLMETVKHLSCSLLQNELQPKTISAKTSALDVWEGPKKCQLLLWWILPQILTPSLNLKILCRIPAPSLTTHLPHPTISYPEYRYLKRFRKLSILSKFWELRKWQEVVMVRGVILFASLLRIAYENRYMTRPLIPFKSRLPSRDAVLHAVFFFRLVYQSCTFWKGNPR